MRVRAKKHVEVVSMAWAGEASCFFLRGPGADHCANVFSVDAAYEGQGVYRQGPRSIEP